MGFKSMDNESQPQLSPTAPRKVTISFQSSPNLESTPQDPSSNPPKKRRCEKLRYLISVRFRMCLLLCGAMFIMQFMNMSLGMTIICMVRQNMSGPMAVHDPKKNGSFYHDIIPEHFEHLHNISESGGDYDWNPMIQGLVLSSLSWGRLLTPAAGLLADRFNVKFLMGGGILLAGLATALIPISSEFSYALVILWRLVTGLADAIVQPSTNKLIPIWFPADERNLALSISTGGRQMAQITVFPLAGFLCEQKGLLSGKAAWPLVFYIGSALAVTWLPCWLFFANQNPQKHRNIRMSEKEKIQKGTGKVLGVKKRTPWKAIFTSPALWANIGAVLCHELPLVIVFVFLPNYMRDVHHFNTKDIGMFSGMPAAAFLITKLVSGQVSACLQAGCSRRLSKNMIAKGFNSVASAGLGISLIILSFQNCAYRMLALVLIISAISFAGFHTPGCMGSLVAIAPSYAATISSIAFFLIGSASLINPIAVKAMVSNGTLAEWRRVFQIAGSIALLPLLFFNIWGSVEEQEWGKTGKKSVVSPAGDGVVPVAFFGGIDDVKVESESKEIKGGIMNAFRRKKSVEE